MSAEATNVSLLCIWIYRQMKGNALIIGKTVGKEPKFAQSKDDHSITIERGFREHSWGRMEDWQTCVQVKQNSQSDSVEIDY